MTVAIVNFNLNYNAGASIATKRICDVLTQNGVEAEIVNITRRPVRGPEGTVNLNPDNYQKFEGKYSKVFIADTGYDLVTDKRLGEAAIDILTVICDSLSLWIHDEYVCVTDSHRFEWWFEELFSRLKVDKVYGITRGILEEFRDSFEVCHEYETGLLPGCGYLKYEGTPEDIHNKKRNVLGYAGRIVSRKKIIQLIRLATAFDHHKLEMYGARTGGIFNKSLEDTCNDLNAPFDTLYKGTYPLGEYPSRNYLYTWNGVMIGRGKKLKFIPRIELSTLESLSYGTVPILFEESVPEWFDEAFYIGISWLELVSLRGRDAWVEMAKKLETKLDEVQSRYASSPEMIEATCKDALGVIDRMWPVTASYNQFVEDMGGRDENRMVSA